MICSRCDKDISAGKEIQIEGSTICKNCSQEILARCHTCRWPIYKNDLIYEISPNLSIEHIFGISQSEKVVQCDWCYQKNLTEQGIKKIWWKYRKWILGTSTALLLFAAFLLLYPSLVKNWKEASWEIIIALLALSISIVSLSYLMISAGFGSRYRVRKRNK